MARKSSAKVSISLCNGRLRLNWSHLGKRYHLYPGLSDSELGRAVAEGKAKTIEADLITGNFDTTLQKYSPEEKRIDSTPISKLFESYFQNRKIRLSSLMTYQAIAKQLIEMMGDRPASKVTFKDCDRVKNQFLEGKAIATAKNGITLFASVWQYGIKKGILTENHWKEIAASINLPPSQLPRPFSKDEVKQITEEFKNHATYSHYLDLIEFLFCSGCRIGEAAALQWRHLSDDCSQCWIGESVSKYGHGATKNNKSRTVRLPKRISDRLSRKREGRSPSDNVFTALRGGRIRGDYFRDKIWKPLLESAGVPYRKLHNTRHTMISHALDRGIPPAVVASITGHSIQELYTSYAGNIRGLQEAPDIFED